MSGAAGGPKSREAILGAPIQSTLFRLAWPAMAAALLGESQTFISMFWIGRLLGEMGLATLGVVAPVFTTLGLIAGAAHIGVQVLTARSAGSGDGKAIPIIVNGGYLGLAWGLAVTLVGLVALGPISRALAGTLDIAGTLRPYLFVWLLFHALPVVSGVAIFAVNATGWTRFGMIQSIVSIGLLVVLMPLFVGALHLDLVGVALSDGCSDVILLVLTCYALYRFRGDLGLGTLRRRDWRLDVALWREILHVGLFFQFARGMDIIAQVALVRVIMGSGQAAVAGYGLARFVITMAMSAVGCLSPAAGIMIGQNVGAGNAARAKACLRIAVTWLAVLGAALIALGTSPGPVVRIFTDNDQVVVQTTEAIRALRWVIPAGMMSGALLRAYTAVSPNKLGNSISIGCAVLTIVMANAWPGAPLASVAVAMITSQYLRLGLLVALYRRLFSSAILRRTAATYTGTH
ncbi:MAG TPA: MATE family efflux transporter [Kofleriaceae bacterium]|nr:MATE family efflux transporter [Kofleriaceae bacterium]